MKFLGIDLGWRSQPSGLCCLEWQDGKLHLRDLQRLESIDQILDWVDTWTGADQPAGIAVDAPTLIPNATGMRLPDRLAHKHFGRYHAGCYPANLGLPFADRVVAFGLSLEAKGFAHAPTIEPQKPRRYQIEVFPHPATVHLFKLDRILKYKKGRVAERQIELLKLRQYILDVLPTLEPGLAIPQGLRRNIEAAVLPDVPAKGAALKALEDQLDSVICAYVAAHWWCWGAERNWVLGDGETGYIVVPMGRSDTSTALTPKDDF